MCVAVVYVLCGERDVRRTVLTERMMPLDKRFTFISVGYVSKCRICERLLPCRSLQRAKLHRVFSTRICSCRDQTLGLFEFLQ